MKASQKDIQRFLQLCKTIREDCKNTNDAEIHRASFVRKFKNHYIPDYLCWVYDIEKDSLLFIGNTKNRLIQWELTFFGFISKIKGCFRSQFIDALISYLTLLKKSRSNVENYLCISLPLKLEASAFLYSKISIVPNMHGTVLLGFALIVIPVKHYTSAKFYLELKFNGSVDTQLTQHIKKSIRPPNMKLTKKQLHVLKLVNLGWRTEDIAIEMCCGVDSIYKINGRLISRLSEYYDMTFLTVKEAAVFYYAPFL